MSSTPSMPKSPPYIVDGKTDAERYLEGCLDGSVVACKKIKRLAEIMLPRFHQEYHGFVFSVEAALRPVKFIEHFCRIPSAENMGQPFIMEPYERMIVELAFGFVDAEGHRQFREVLVEIARKNGKTSLLAALNLYMLTSDGEPAAECYNGATNTQQARLCFGSTNDMVKMSPMLRKRIRRGMVQKRGISGLNYDKSNSYLCTISSKSDSLDGLNMHFGVLDELAACKDQGATYRLLTGAMSSRRQPMLFVISTQGKVRNNIWDNRLDVCNKWLSGEMTSDRILPILFEQDDREEVFAGLEEENRWLWKKSNPGLGTVKKESSMLEMVQQAFENRADVPEVLMKQFNIPALEYESFLDYDECINDEPVPFNPNVDRYCCIGFDLASSGDLNAAVALYKRPGDDNFYERTCCWIANEQVNINTKGFKERDAVPYRQWASDGWLNIVEGDKVNQMVIIEWIRSLVDDGLYPMAVAYDSWHVDDWTERELKRLCGETRVHAVPQYAKVLSPLMKEHKIDLRARRIINDSPVTHWARMNVEASVDNNDNYQPRKKNLDPHKKIDPYMAELFAFKAYKLHEEEYTNMVNGEEEEE